MENNAQPQPYEHNLIITIANSGSVDVIMDAAKEAGATGGTILHGRGAGLKDTETFLGISIQPEKDVLFIVARTDEKQKIMQAISQSSEFSEDHKCITFSLPVDNLAGNDLLKSNN